MIWIIGGTKDSRVIAKNLSEAGKEIIVSTATSYGKKLLNELNIEVIVKRMNVDEMKELIISRGISILIDASHPYADKVSQEAIDSCRETNIQYIRFEREMLSYENAVKFSTIEEITTYLNLNSKGENILSTLGSKNLSDLKHIDNINSLFIRILPVKESVSHAEELGFLAKNIIALQGPFTKEFNQAIIKNYNIKYLLTKESGASGGEMEKVQACVAEGVKILVLKRPIIDYPRVFNSVDILLKNVYGQK